MGRAEKAISKVAEKASEAVSEVVGAEIPVGDVLLMGLGVVFIACLVSHFVFGIGEDPLENVRDPRSGAAL